MPSDSGHAIADLSTVAADLEVGLEHGDLTGVLGCSVLRVHAVRLPAGESLTLPPEDERIVVPLAREVGSETDRRIGRAPPGEPWYIDFDAAGMALILSATAEPESGEPRWLDLDAVDFTAPSTSDVATAHLTAELGCTGLKANARVLEPGQAVPLHTEGTQEELFLPLDEGGSMQVGAGTVETPPGSIVRVAPDIPRSARNDGQAAAVWLMFGAPPTGGPTEWDPGATVVEDERSRP